MLYPDISAHLEAMRASVFHTSDQNPLMTLPRSGSRRILPLEGSAYAAQATLASMQSVLIGEDLKIASITADEGPTIKRFRPRAQGRATPIHKRTAHLSILLTEKDAA